MQTHQTRENGVLGLSVSGCDGKVNWSGRVDSNTDLLVSNLGQGVLREFAPVYWSFAGVRLPP
jgi:hypothetical protein